MERGEVWWAEIDGKQPVVLLSGGPGPAFAAVQVVEPATPAQKIGFVLLSGAQAVDADERCRILAAAGPDTRAGGIEVFLGAEEGLPRSGVVRLALPREGKVFCTWEATVSVDSLVERIGTLSPAKLRELDTALALAGHR
ncbi:hypothetical protein ACWT_4369 [Actinoplanes sp. SE50]|uniref:hypothetical protein n=1 Tax=unclassified Actinoplanes TaxID=2626549 RepID=UPI00023EC9AB|nr:MULTISPECIES: hypothetical protein [unclassified Actinoplanes]AEV85389.1 hypothetical protein ACPL_4498 [Actinoplanes sp. SE50/110]ATO83784.1 hypothetical protein ACWT_4369 [Actinoplanes sp. SE50]SLM01192.1 hypothetical protein ACSP50_4428 [Actinoplanes sp. SE50/110]